MAHLRDRLCLVPFCDLTDSPKIGHHAIGSPYFDAKGQANFPDPVVVAVRADIVDPVLPPATALTVSCHTRPYHAYGPVIRRVFERSAPHLFPEVRRGMEGVMEIGEVRTIPPGGLAEQTKQILLACVATMTAGTDTTILKETLHNLSQTFSQMPPGSTMRLPLIGTGKARAEVPTEEVFRDVIGLILSQLYDTLLPRNPRHSPRRLLIVHPFEYEAQLIANTLAERSVFLTLLDKMGLHIRDKRLVYGFAYGDKEENCLVDRDLFPRALDYLDLALDKLLQGNRKEALIDAARGVEVEPALGGVYAYIRKLTQKKRGLLEALLDESIQLVEDGRVFDAFSVSNTFARLGGGKKEDAFFQALRSQALGTCQAALESRLLYENYMLVEEALSKMNESEDVASSSETSPEYRFEIPMPPKDDFDKLDGVLERVPEKIIQNSLHIAIRKLLADHFEPLGAKQSIQNLLQLEEHKKLKLSKKQKELCLKMIKLADDANEKKPRTAASVLQKSILESLLKLLPKHTTLRIEAARFYLKGGISRGSGYGNVVTQTELKQAWEHLQAGLDADPNDYGTLSYIGFLIFLQGEKFLSVAEEYYMLFHRVLNQELHTGLYAHHRMITPSGKEVLVGIRDPYSRQANSYYQKYAEHVNDFAQLARVLKEGESGEAAMGLYRQTLHNLGEIGRYDLVQLHEELLGPNWIALLARGQKKMGTIPLPFGEISIDFLLNVYRKVRRWWKFRNLKSEQLQKALKTMIERLGKRM